MTVSLDLEQLPPPQIIEELDFDAILAAMKADFVARYPEYTANLASDPVAKLLEAASYREMLIRQRVNDAARSNLLAFATGTDLDHLASFYGVQRLSAESDTGFRSRIQQRIQGWANAGGAAHYRYWALTSDERVADAAVSSPAPGLVRIAILSGETGGEAAPALLEAVKATVMRDDVRVLTDTVEVVSATIIAVDIEATVYLYPHAPQEVATQLETDFPARLDASRGLGWDLTRSWIIAQMHPSGVQRVELQAPLNDTVAGPDDCVKLGTFTLTFGGRDR